MTAQHVAAGDAAVIDQLRQAGVDLSQPLVVRHYLYFLREGDARKVARQLGADATHQVTVSRAAKGPDWLVLLEVAIVVTPASVAQFRVALDAMAARMGGQYDGWEAAVPQI